MTKILMAISFLFLVGISFSNAEKVYAQKKTYGLKCAFLEDFHEGALSNKLTCAMSPDKVFSSKTRKYRKEEYCKHEGVFSAEELKNFTVDFKKNRVSYTSTSELTPSALIEMKRYYMKEGKSEKEAERLINIKNSDDLTFKIDDLVLTKRTMYRDPITGEFNKREATAYSVHFSNQILHFRR